MLLLHIHFFPWSPSVAALIIEMQCFIGILVTFFVILFFHLGDRSNTEKYTAFLRRTLNLFQSLILLPRTSTLSAKR